jgi:hypothetical protein
MAIRMVHENPFSDRIDIYVWGRGFTLYQLHDTIISIVQTDDEEYIKQFITFGRTGIIEIDTDKLLNLMENIYD